MTNNIISSPSGNNYKTFIYKNKCVRIFLCDDYKFNILLMR